MARCETKIRPFPGDTEVWCNRHDVEHEDHAGDVHDYAYPGSLTLVNWNDSDRRSYVGEWPGKCDQAPGCVLPLRHSGQCVI